jgi:hypothetical protein
MISLYHIHDNGVSIFDYLHVQNLQITSPIISLDLPKISQAVDVQPILENADSGDQR